MKESKLTQGWCSRSQHLEDSQEEVTLQEDVMAVGSQTVMLPEAGDEEMGGSLQPAAVEAAEEEEVGHRG